MLFFVNQSGNVMVAPSRLSVGKSTLIIPLIDSRFNFLTLSSKFAVRPAMQVQGTAGGANFLRVMGEDPPILQISGLITGTTDCDKVRRLHSAFTSGVELFAASSVVATPNPIQYTLGDGVFKRAFLIDISLTGSESFADVVQFNMSLLSEPVVPIAIPAVFAGAAAGAVAAGGAPAADPPWLMNGGEDGTVEPISVFSYRSSNASLTDRPVGFNSLAASTSPLGSGQRALDGSLTNTSNVRGVVTLANS